MPSPADLSVSLQSLISPGHQRPEGLYEPLTSLQVRVPRFPIEAYLALGQPEEARTHGLSQDDPRVQRAMAVGSLALLDELERTSLSARDQARRDRKLLRYLIRMATRPTPYGLFAGVGLADFGERTDLSLAERSHSMQTRPDMSWLMNLVWMLEHVPGVHEHVRLVANTAAYVRRGRIFLLEPLFIGQTRATEAVSLRATRVALQALSLARTPIAYPELVEALLASTRGATVSKVEGLILTLWEHTLLISDLHPPLTNGSPADFLQKRLAGIPAAAALLESLTAYLQAIAAWDASADTTGAVPYRRLVEQAQQITAQVEALAGAHKERDATTTEKKEHDRPEPREQQSSVFLQVDSAVHLRGCQISRNVAEEIVRAAELMLRLSALPEGLPYLRAYRQTFLERYGADREVPLLEVLDPQFGLGVAEITFPPKLQGKRTSDAPGFPTREQELRRLALMALRERQLVVHLNEEHLKRLETCTPAERAIPISLDIYALLAAPSPEALDQGDYLVVIGPNVGALQAGRSMGRFADLVGPPACTFVAHTAKEEARLAPEQILAEMAYLPRESRAMNVAIRPGVRSHEVVYGVMPGIAQEQVIPLDELALGVRDGRFYVRWLPHNKEVLIRAGHMLSTMRAPAAVKLLSDLSLDQVAVMTNFSWEECSQFPFLPRIQVGRIVLARACWRINSQFHLPELALQEAPERFLESLQGWRERWQVPRYVYLIQGDNWLLLDLTCPAQVEEVRASLRLLKDGETMMLEEALPGPEHAWLPGPGGHYLTEFVVSLIRRAPEKRAATSPSTEAPSPAIIPSAVRLQPPGSEWLFMKLYCAPTLQEGLIAGPLRTFVQEALENQRATDWFFLRYSDPDPHIRLRFRGDPQTLMSQLMPELCQWGTRLMTEGPCQKFTFDVYDREIERYGGPAGIEAAESLFCADSAAVAEMLHLQRTNVLTLEPRLLAVLSVDDLLAALGFSPFERLQWYREGITQQKASGLSYRQQGAQLRSLLGDPQALEQQAGGKQLAAIFIVRQARLVPIAQQLSEAANHQALSRPAPTIYRSFVHMHCNRLLGTDREGERHVLELLLRTRTGLERAPVLQ